MAAVFKVSQVAEVLRDKWAHAATCPARPGWHRSGGKPSASTRLELGEGRERVMDPWASAQTWVPSYRWVTRAREGFCNHLARAGLQPAFSSSCLFLAGRCFSGWPWESSRVSYKAGIFDSLQPCLQPGVSMTPFLPASVLPGGR